MKVVYFSLVVLLSTMNMAVASDISTKCSSASGNIKWEESSHWEGVKIVTHVDWATKAEQVQKIAVDELEIQFSDEMEIATEQIGTASHEYKRAKLMLRPLPGKSLPNAYDKNISENGSLSDYVICRTTRTSTPR